VWYTVIPIIWNEMITINPIYIHSPKNGYDPSLVNILLDVVANIKLNSEIISQHEAVWNSISQNNYLSIMSICLKLSCIFCIIMDTSFMCLFPINFIPPICLTVSCFIIKRSFIWFVLIFMLVVLLIIFCSFESLSISWFSIKFSCIGVILTLTLICTNNHNFVFNEFLIIFRLIIKFSSIRDILANLFWAIYLWFFLSKLFFIWWFSIKFCCIRAILTLA